MIPLTLDFPYFEASPDERLLRLREFAEAQIEHIVLSTPIMEIFTREFGMIDEWRNMLRQFHIRFTDAHAPFDTWGNIGMPRTEFRELSVARLRILLQICSRLEVTTLAIHTGNTFNRQFGDFTFDDYAGAMRRSLEELLPDAEHYGVIIALENQWTPLNHSRHLLATMREFNSPFLGLCFDSGHANLTEKGMNFPDSSCVPSQWAALGCPVEWEENLVEKFQPWMVNCHLHDNHGILDEHLMPGQGNVDWVRVTRALQNSPRLQCIQGEANFPCEGVTPAEYLSILRSIAEGC